MEAVADLRKGSARNLKEMQTIGVSVAAIAFNNVDRNRERRAAQLRGESEAFDDWKLKRQGVDPDIEIVGSLPSYERVMWKRHAPR